jgi:hypothetical protein
MVGRFETKDSVGGTPTDATGTVALPEKSEMIEGSPAVLACGGAQRVNIISL